MAWKAACVAGVWRMLEKRQKLSGDRSCRILLVYSQGCTTITTVCFRTLLLLQKETLYPLPITSQSPNSSCFYPSPPSNHSSLSVSMDFPILNISYHWNHSICGLYVYLLSLSVMFSRLIHTIACSSALFLFMAE